MKIELTKEQSQHLIELGVPMEKASKDRISTVEMNVYSIFTLIDLLEVLPKEIENEGLKAYFFQQWYEGKWYVGYTGETWVSEFKAEELIDALYELAVWCIENQHLKFDKSN